MEELDGHSKNDGSSAFDQIFGFLGAAGFIAVLVYAQSNI